jgi:hypothetical protein
MFLPLLDDLLLWSELPRLPKQQNKDLRKPLADFLTLPVVLLEPLTVFTITEKSNSETMNEWIGLQLGLRL